MIKNILVLGAGRSSAVLIKYLIDNCEACNWHLTIADAAPENVRTNFPESNLVRITAFDASDVLQREKEISNANLVISLLPPQLHFPVAVDCIKYSKHFLTASYLTPEIAELDQQARQKGILMLNECGLDPGIDHMSAMEIINRLHNAGCTILSFKSYTGGLVAPESNDNPWGYKFSWNPRNVILAGQGTARYINGSVYKYIPYSRVFTDIETINVDGTGTFDGYANRDSLAYRHHYKLENVPTLLRGTLRHSGFCRAWDIFVKLGLTDDSFVIEKSEELTYAQIVRSFLPSSLKHRELIDAVAYLCDLPVEGEAMSKFIWTGILEEEKSGLKNATPAMILQHLLMSKWKLEPGDKDMVVMQHLFMYMNKDGVEKNLVSSLVVKGENQQYTAMAKTVGLPLAIVAKLLLQEKINIVGVHLPVIKEIYEPVLEELKTEGISFTEIN
jgi:saccharopine dehydrogenase-like NADP-dependent oxidoreductase